MMKKIIACLLLPLILGACTNTQTTSGESYLERYQNVPTVGAASQDGVSIEDQIRQVAAVEPVLRFPARIGLARIDRGHLSSMPGVELEAWMKVRDNLGKEFGEFVPVNPLVANMVSKNVSRSQNARITDVMSKIRLGAARQHLDAVLIYEVYSKSDSEANVLSIADLTIIGGFLLPSRAIEAEGFANAMLIDVVQGYPYGTAEITLDKQSALATTWGSQHSLNNLENKVKSKAAIKLAEEAEEMFRKLRWELHQKDH